MRKAIVDPLLICPAVGAQQMDMRLTRRAFSLFSLVDGNKQDNQRAQYQGFHNGQYPNIPRR
jgi:hypothetical protein